MGQKGLGMVRFGQGRRWKDKDMGRIGTRVWTNRVTMIDADKGQGKIQDGYTCQKQVKTVFKFLEFVVSLFFFFLFLFTNEK